MREVAKHANEIRNLRRYSVSLRYSIYSMLEEYDSAVKRVMGLPDFREALTKAEVDFLGKISIIVNDAQAISNTSVDVSEVNTLACKMVQPDILKQEAMRMSDIKRQARDRPLLIVTATDVETNAIRSAFASAGEMKAKPLAVGEKDYFELGKFNGNRVLLTRTEMGSLSAGSSAISVHDAILEVNPVAVVLAGIAFGVDEQKQEIGRILISKQILQYESQKILDKSPVFRGDRVTASTWLLEKFRNAALDWNDAEIQFGLMLTGEKLIDNIDFRSLLLAAEPEAIGGEMEGAGVYAVCQRKKVDWIIAKAICDWGYDKGVLKDERQQIAAKNCADFLLFAMQTCVFTRLSV